MSRANGGPAIEIDNVEQVSTSPASSPGGQAAVLTYGVTRTPADGTAKHYRAEARVETSQFGNGGWMMSCIEVASPVDQFSHDLPTMLAMVNSLRENPEVCAQILRSNANAMQQAQQQQFEQGQQAHRDQMASYDAHNKAWAAGEVDKSRSNADFIETIRGERAVLDTTTGEKGYADLMDAGKVVDELNTHDPGRYQELPLRDELYPVAGQRN